MTKDIITKEDILNRLNYIDEIHYKREEQGYLDDDIEYEMEREELLNELKEEENV